MEEKSSKLVKELNKIQEEQDSIKDELRSRVEDGEILSEDPDTIETALNSVYNHSGKSEDRLYTEMFHVRLRNLKDHGYDISTRLCAIQSAIRYASEQNNAKIRNLAAYLAAKTDREYESMLRINID